MFSLLERWALRRTGRSCVPDGLRVYAVGDVHGCRSQLIHLLEVIEQDRAEYAGVVHLVFLGDLIDRGPDSAGVIEHLRIADLPADKVTFIMGNHEEIMLDCYDGKAERYVFWLKFGGRQTLLSYGVSSDELDSDGFDLRAAMRRNISPDHIAFVRSFEDTLRLGDYLFVHAGIRPGTPLDKQSRADLRWIRNAFLADNTNFGVTVVHGHTIVPKIIRRPNRISVDTGCYNTGTLSALVLEGNESSALAVSH